MLHNLSTAKKLKKQIYWTTCNASKDGRLSEHGYSKSPGTMN